MSIPQSTLNALLPIHVMFRILYEIFQIYSLSDELQYILTGMIFWWSIFLRHGAIGAVAWYFKPLYMSCLNFLPFRSLNFKLYTLAIIEYSSMVKTYRSYNTSFLPPFFRNLHGRKQPKLSERGAIPHPICLLVNEAVCIYWIFYAEVKPY